jgi:hypothetical protein
MRTIGGSPSATMLAGPFVTSRAAWASATQIRSWSPSGVELNSDWPRSKATARCCSRRNAAGGRKAAR